MKEWVRIQSTSIELAQHHANTAQNNNKYSTNHNCVTFVKGMHQYSSQINTLSEGRELYKAAADIGCEIVSTGKPTYWPTNPKTTPDLIDFFVFKNISTNCNKIEECFDLNSDQYI
jgi:hypothetical protein